MQRPVIMALGAFCCTLALGAAFAQTPQASPKPILADPSIAPPGWTVPKNEFGQPDLSGFWSNATTTPTTRNPRVSTGPTLSHEEAQKLEANIAEAFAQRDVSSDPNVLPGSAEDKAKDARLGAVRPDVIGAGGKVGGYNAFWLDPGSQFVRIKGEYRTSILTTPDGQIPPRKDGQKSDARQYDEENAVNLGSYDSYETRPLGERCLAFGRNAPPPMLPNGFYNNNYQIVQTADSAVIHIEQIHDVRVVRLNSQHRTDGVRQWQGDSVGHYEGNTLVVETINIPQKQNFFGGWRKLKVTERFTRVSPTQIDYSFQVEEPDVWEKPWGGEYTFHPLGGSIYENACHEGNYSLPGILRGGQAKG